MTLDGDGRLGALVNLYGRCPGLALEDLTLRGFKRYGVWVTNCEGGSGDRRATLARVHFVTSQGGQTALFFQVLANYPELPKNRNFVIRDSCSFDGPGAKVKTTDPADQEEVELPPEVKLVPGR